MKKNSIAHIIFCNVLFECIHLPSWMSQQGIISLYFPIKQKGDFKCIVHHSGIDKSIVFHNYFLGVGRFVPTGFQSIHWSYILS